MEWIDTTIKLPDEQDRVLLFTPYPIFGNDHSCVGDKESIALCTTRINSAVVPVFTHWMPLPEMPDFNNRNWDK